MEVINTNLVLEDFNIYLFFPYFALGNYLPLSPVGVISLLLLQYSFDVFIISYSELFSAEDRFLILHDIIMVLIILICQILKNLSTLCLPLYIAKWQNFRTA